MEASSDGVVRGGYVARGAAARSESVTARAASARRWWWSSFRAIIAAAIERAKNKGTPL